MAIHILLRKIDEDQTGAVYEFGPNEGTISEVFVSRDARQVSLLCINKPGAEGFYLPRLRKVLEQRGGEFPDTAEYRA